MSVLECNQDVGKETSVIKQINSKIIYIYSNTIGTQLRTNNTNQPELCKQTQEERGKPRKDIADYFKN